LGEAPYLHNISKNTNYPRVARILAAVLWFLSARWIFTFKVFTK